MKCPYCEFELDDKKGYLYCVKCGHKIEKCPTCSKILTSKIRYCPNDGTEIPQEIYDNLPSVKVPQKENPDNGDQKESKKSKKILVIGFISAGVLVCIGGFFLVKNASSLKNQFSSWVTVFRDDKTNEDVESILIDSYVADETEMLSNISEIMNEDDNTEDTLLKESDFSEIVQEIDISSKEPNFTEASVIDSEEGNDIKEIDSGIEERNDIEEIDSSIEEDNDSDNTEEISIEYDAITMEHIKSVNATSELVEKAVRHSKERLIDGDLTKAWVEGVSGQGIGESVSLNFDGVYTITGLSINAGYQKNKDLYAKNSRPKQITVEFSDGSSQVFELEDKYAAQVLLLDVPVNSEYIKITIDSVYAGNKYKDTCISEISVF